MLKTLATILAVGVLATGGCSTSSEPDPARLCAIDNEFSALQIPENAQDMLDNGQAARELLDEAIAVAPDDIRPAIEITRIGRLEFLAAVEAAIEAEPEVFADGLWEDGELADSRRIDAAIVASFVPGNPAADADAEWEEWTDANC
ncbi:MAG: hypothetical protein ACR2N7_02095 [Acidimicrobiia bacterium]